MKITYNGKEVRDSKGRFSSFSKKLKWWTGVALLLYGVYLAGGFFQPRAVAINNIVEIDNLTPKIEELKDSIVEDIRNCERSKYNENDGIIIFDSNNEASIGTFQYQRKTVQHYYNTLYKQKITPKEAILIALDEAKARQLTKDIIFKDSKGWKNWYNCGVKINAEGRLQTINELTK